MQGKAWTKLEVVINYEQGQYPKDVVVTIMDEQRIQAVKDLQQRNAIIKATCSIRANEYNGRWFNNIDCYRVDEYQPQQQMGGYSQQPMQQAYQQPQMPQQGFQAPAQQQIPYQQQPAQAYQGSGGQVQGQGNPNDGQIPF